MSRYLDKIYGKIPPEDRLNISNNLRPFLTTFNLT